MAEFSAITIGENTYDIKDATARTGLAGKQNTLTAGTGINIVGDVISATGGGGASEADDVSYDNTSSGLTATNVQDAIDEVNDAISYLTNEHKVGKWIDGSDLYEKTFSVKNPSSGSVVIETLVGEVVDIQGIFRRTDGAVMPSPYYDTNTYRLFYTINANNVLSMYIAGYNISEAIVTVRYIKN